ncbi:MAG: hypothetical protein AB7F31_07135 [Parachlamydiales bacterium]
MRSFVFALSLMALVSVKAQGGYTFEAYETKYTLGTEYQFTSNEGMGGMAKKRALSPWTSYYLYDNEGRYQGYGYIQLSLWGLFGAWGAELPVYDECGKSIGFIDGQAVTTAAARYTIYNGDGEKIGIAFLDSKKSGFTIVDGKTEQKTIAYLSRQFIPDAPDYWVVHVNDRAAIDERIIKVFAAFAVDKQTQFRKDT